MNELRTFKKFVDLQQARDLAEVLSRNGITNKVVEPLTLLDSNFGANELSKKPGFMLVIFFPAWRCNRHINGGYIWKGTKTLLDGRKVYNYTIDDRKQGRNIFFIGLIMLPIVILLQLYLEL